MEITALCMIVASLTVIPNRSQFFQHESVSLSCEQQGNSSGWRVMKNTSLSGLTSECSTQRGKGNESLCFIDVLYPSDIGVYWCQSDSGWCSHTFNITVTRGSVILESPALPVMEGSDVTLRCKTQTTLSNLTADFYKDGLLIRTDSTGETTIHSVSKSDEGLYKCSMSDSGESPESWLAVTVLHPEPSHLPPERVLLPAVGACIMFLLVLLYLTRRHRALCFAAAEAEAEVASYVDVSITQEAQPKEKKDVADPPSPYSTIQKVPENRGV